jgi:hypothetical protein
MTAATAARRGAKTKVSAPKKKSVKVQTPAAAKKSAAPTTITKAELPLIGTDLAGGKFAGIVRGEHGHDVAIVDLGYSAHNMTFDKAQKWAEAQGGVAPDRAEARVLWANLDLHDEKKPAEWLWLRTPYAGNESYAWFQYFGYGGQGTTTRTMSSVPARSAD